MPSAQEIAGTAAQMMAKQPMSAAERFNQRQLQDANGKPVDMPKEAPAQEAAPAQAPTCAHCGNDPTSPPEMNKSNAVDTTTMNPEVGKIGDKFMSAFGGLKSALGGQ